MGSNVMAHKGFSGLIQLTAALALTGVVWVQGAEAAPSIPEGRLTGDAGRDITGNTNAQSPDQSKDLSWDAGKFSNTPGEQREIRLAPNLAFRGLMDMKANKDMLKGLITAQIPVMYQTMMMVENGAATGFMGSVESVAALLNNTMGAAQLEMAMRRAVGPDAEKQYVNAVYDGLEEQNEGQNLWPIGLWSASNDLVTEPMTGPKYQLAGRYQEEGTAGASIIQHLPTEARKNGDETEWTLSNIIFGQDSSAGDERAEKIKGFFKEVVGDVKYTTKSADLKDPKVLVKIAWVKPTLQASVEKSGSSTFAAKSLSSSSDSMTTMASTSTMASGDNKLPVPDQVFGPHVKKEEIRKKTWEKMYMLLGSYCEFKKTNGNKGLQLFNKKFASEWIDTVDSKLMDDISSNSLKVSLNMVDQIFKIWVQTTTDSTQPTKIQCKFENAADEMPKGFEESDGGDSCEGAEKARKCRRNKALYRIVDILADDKFIDEAKDVYEKAMQNALNKDVSTAGLVNTLFCNSFLTNENGESALNSQCDIGFWFDSASGLNRQRWSDQLEATAKLAQSLGGSSNFRFQPNNSLTAAGGGFDSAGDADPGAGGGK
jgi:hypothetical protein